MRGLTVLIILSSLVLGGCATSDKKQAAAEMAVRSYYVAFPPTGDAPPHNVAGVLRVPQGIDGKLPAVVIVHGSNGVDGRGGYHAASLNTHGIATLEIDLWTARRNFAGASGRPKSVPETLPDAFGALKYLAGLPFIDPTRIGITGYSWGGVVSMLTATKPYADKFSDDGLRFAAHVPFYPVCWVYNTVPGYEFAQLTAAPVLLLAGADDTYDEPDTCNKLVEGLPADARQYVSVTVYPGATHAWNMPGDALLIVNDPFAHKGKGGEVRFQSNPEVTEQSRVATDAFFVKALGVKK